MRQGSGLRPRDLVMVEQRFGGIEGLAEHWMPIVRRIEFSWARTKVKRLCKVGAWVRIRKEQRD